MGASLRARGVEVEYEGFTIPYVRPPRKTRYTPDFLLPNGIVIETKGRFLAADRQKHLLLRAQYPDLDIRFVFSNPNVRLSRTSKITYGGWCEKHQFLFAANDVPDEWLDEPPEPTRLDAVRAIIERRAAR